MKTSEFFGKFKSGYLWGNLLAMAVVVVLLLVGVKYALDVYTHHGESLTVPSVKHKKYGGVGHGLREDAASRCHP